jgi:hypothetical protein
MWVKLLARAGRGEPGTRDRLAAFLAAERFARYLAGPARGYLELERRTVGRLGYRLLPGLFARYLVCLGRGCLELELRTADRLAGRARSASGCPPLQVICPWLVFPDVSGLPSGLA